MDMGHPQCTRTHTLTRCTDVPSEESVGMLGSFAVTCDGSEKVVIRSEATQASPHAAPSLSALSIVKSAKES